jgi:hypothetical protein
MTIDLFKSVLLRDYSERDVQKEIRFIQPLTRNIIDYAISTLQHFFSKEETFDYALCILLLNCIEIADAIDTLMASSCIEPCYSLLRTSFEARISIAYIVKANSQKRSITWLCHSLLKDKKYAEKFLFESSEGKIFFDALQRDGSDHHKYLSSEQKSKQIVTKIDDLLSDPSVKEYVKIIQEEEIKRKKRKDYRPVEWYYFFPEGQNPSPNSIKGLCRELKVEELYLLLYSLWSETVHPGSRERYIHNLFGRERQNVLRDKSNIFDVANFNIVILLSALRSLYQHFNQLNTFEEWKKSIEPSFTLLETFAIDPSKFQ